MREMGVIVKRRKKKEAASRIIGEGRIEVGIISEVL
jgi:hypothetical protein